jgi:hypothetical protein
MTNLKAVIRQARSHSFGAWYLRCSYLKRDLALHPSSTRLQGTSTPSSVLECIQLIAIGKSEAKDLPWMEERVI